MTGLAALVVVAAVFWISRGPSIDRQLANAVKRGDILAVRSLLERGADPNAHSRTRPPYRPWPIRSLADVHQWVVAKSMPEPFSPTLLMLAAESGWDEICVVLIAHGARVDERVHLSGFPALLHASARGHTSTVRVLLEHGADPNAQNYISEGGPALADAAARNDLVMAKVLLDHGADSNGGYKEGGDILWRAEVNKLHAMVALLKQYGAKEHPDWGLHYEAPKYAQR